MLDLDLNSFKSSPRREFPWVTTIVLALLLLVALSAPIRALLVYERAAILRGEIWRLVTGNLVHFSDGHFFYDVLALGIAGLMIERRGYPGFAVLCATAALGIGGALLLVEPQTNYYGGASGIATAAIVFLALHGLELGGAYRWVCSAALICVGCKIVAEFAVGRSLFLAQNDSGLVNCPLSHLVGALSALGLYALKRITCVCGSVASQLCASSEQ